MTLDIKEIIEAGEKCKNKIGTTYVTSINKPLTYTFEKNKNKDFISSVQRSNAIKLGPNHYKIFDAGGFTSKDNLKKVKFAFAKDAKTSFIEQLA